jgi:hypothetical protein
MFNKFNYQTQTVSCFDENANLKEKITLKGLNNCLCSKSDGAFIYHHRALLIQSQSRKMIIKLFFKSF